MLVAAAVMASRVPFEFEFTPDEEAKWAEGDEASTPVPRRKTNWSVVDFAPPDRDDRDGWYRGARGACKTPRVVAIVEEVCPAPADHRNISRRQRATS